MEIFYIIKESQIYIQYMSKLSLRIVINTSTSAVSDPQILKLIPNQHLVRI